MLVKLKISHLISLFPFSLLVVRRKSPLTSQIIIPIEQLMQEPYSSIICFPKQSEKELQSRIAELRSHGVSALEFGGKANVYGVPIQVLGKGFVGIVVVAHLKGGRVAIKIRRIDADRVDLLHEGAMLTRASSAGVAPKFVSASKNFLLMQLIEGVLLPDWLKKNTDKTEVRRVLSDVLESCRKLDEVGVDHGELSKAPKHIIVDAELKAWIVDFETASDKRRPANLPAICNFLFTGKGEVARAVAAFLGERNKGEVIKAVGLYKKAQTMESFNFVLHVCLGD